MKNQIFENDVFQGACKMSFFVVFCCVLVLLGLQCHFALHAQRHLQLELSRKIVHLKNDILQCACKTSFFVFFSVGVFLISFRFLIAKI